MHLDRVNNASKNDYENADDDHLVVLAPLRRRWCLSGRDGFGFLSLPPSLRGGIRRLCGSEMPIFHCAEREKTEAKGSHWGDQTRDRTLDRTRLARLVSSSRVQRQQRAHRRVRSSSREVAKHARSIGHGGASGHDRPDASDRVWVLTGIDRTLEL
jgi:hypothetical protein